ncbi:AI-2E family transporter [Clostridium sp. JS66]|uniref:AI-2E family transporter n=1 Tax=Clostridium sp. JS66 TaxID=3064705 RepID=UPI00298D681B|nr:AI-2E family transporter [Clostridium sp. JS66]WPC40784.1 AI-2E family transporter [Clostridium sp. JS66]
MKKVKRIYKYILTIIIVFLIILLGLRSSAIREAIYLLFISFIIAYTLRPMNKYMEQNGIRKKFAAVSLICVLILITMTIFLLIVPSAFKESLNISYTIDKIQKIIDNLYSKLKPISNNKTIYAVINNVSIKMNNQLISLFSKIFDSALNIGQNIVSIAVIPIISYYFLADGDNIANKLLNFFPIKSRNMVKKISKDIDKILGRYIVSQLLLCAFIGIVTFAILIFLHVDFPIILSILNAFFNIIPYFGPVFGAVPAIFIALIKSPQKAMWVLIWLYLLQQIEGNILSPKITGDSVNMHPLMVIILLVVGGKIAGFLGMILAIPVGVMIKVIYEDLNYYLF